MVEYLFCRIKELKEIHFLIKRITETNYLNEKGYFYIYKTNVITKT